MNNKEFINNHLNGTHLQFYLRTVRDCYLQRISESEAPKERLAQFAVEDAQALMHVMGYTNALECSDD